MKAPALALGIAVVIAGCEIPSTADRHTPRPSLRIAADMNLLPVLASLPLFNVQPASFGDSEKRLIALQQGRVDVAVAVADVTYLGFHGRLLHQAEPLDRVRGIALLRPTVVHLLVGPSTDVSHGFRGMRVVLGDPTGGNAALGEKLIQSLGISRSEMQGEFLPRDAAVGKLLEKRVDAMIVTGHLPHDAVVRALDGGARLQDIDGPEVERLRMFYPLLKRMLIPRGTYPTQDHSVHTVGVDLLLVCRADLDPDLVYKLTRAYFEDTPENVRKQTDPQRAPAVIIPLHPGAARYYREREVRR